MVRLNMIYTSPIQRGWVLSLPQYVYYLSLCLPVGEDEVRSRWRCIQSIKDTDTQLVSMLTPRGVRLQAIFVQMPNALPLNVLKKHSEDSRCIMASRERLFV
jgi:hypothetical protein